MPPELLRTAGRVSTSALCAAAVIAKRRGSAQEKQREAKGFEPRRSPPRPKIYGVGDGDWSELAKDCVAFANASGGTLSIAIDDGQNLAPPEQRIPPELPDLLRRKLAERTVHVTALPNVATAANGGQYIELTVPRSTAVVGQYYCFG